MTKETRTFRPEFSETLRSSIWTMWRCEKYAGLVICGGVLTQWFNIGKINSKTRLHVHIVDRRVSESYEFARKKVKQCWGYPGTVYFFDEMEIPLTQGQGLILSRFYNKHGRAYVYMEVE